MTNGAHTVHVWSGIKSLIALNPGEFELHAISQAAAETLGVLFDIWRFGFADGLGNMWRSQCRVGSC